MKELFLTVLGMSGTASVIILVVLAARLALKKAPKVFSYVLWAVVLFRLLCPLTIESAFSLLPSVKIVPVAGRGESTAQVIRVQTGITTVDRPVNDFFVEHPYQGLLAVPEDDMPVTEPVPVIPESGPAADWRTVPAVIWLAGVGLLLGYSVVSLILLRRRLVGSAPLAGEKNVRLADHIPSPFVLGLFWPKIYLPSDLPEAERDYILLHERTHIRRGDHITRGLAWAALAVHWFNPLVWLAFHLAGKDMEMSCDEAVLRKMGRDVRADYSTSLLRLSTGSKKLPAGPLAFGGGDPQSRIKNVLNYQKPALWVVVLGLLAVLTAGAALATDRTADTPEPSGVNLDDVAANLSFSLDGEDGEYFVRIGGTVEGAEVNRAYWSPKNLDALYDGQIDGHLNLVYQFASGTEHITAWWADGAHTSVTVSAQMSAMLMSNFAGYRVFTVDLSGQGKVTSSEEISLWEEPISVVMHPESLTDEEAVRAARVAAKLLTEAEEFYALVWVPAGAAAPDDMELMLSDVEIALIGEGSWNTVSGHVGDFVVEDGAVYHYDNMYNFEETLGIFYPDFDSGGMAGQLKAEWADEDRTLVRVSTQNMALISSGFPDDGYYTFTVLLTEDGGKVTEMERVEGKTVYPESISDEEAVKAARIAGTIMKEARRILEEIWTDGVTSDEKLFWVESDYIRVGRAGNAFVAWHPSSSGDGTGTLSFYRDPAFCCLPFAGELSEGGALWANGEETAITVDLSIKDDRVDRGTMSGFHFRFTVDLNRNVVTEHQFESDVPGETRELSNQEMLDTARTLAQIMYGAEYYYSSLYPGALPFEEPLNMWFGSGAGGWRTILTLNPDGTFAGEYTDSDMGAGGPGYDSTEYICKFHGRFGDIIRVTDSSWHLTLKELALDTGHPVGEDWIERKEGDPGTYYNLRQVASEPYGLDGKDGRALAPGAEFVLYGPNASARHGEELRGMENEKSDLHEFWSWWPKRYAISEGNGGTLDCWGLRNVETGYGFFDFEAWGIHE